MPDLAAEFLELICISDLAGLGPEPRASRLQRGPLESLLNTWFETRVIAADCRPSLSSAALLWHDHLEESHALSQEIPNTTGSFLHGIMHRREPDHDNARYWFHRVGRHDAFYTIARAATPYLVQHGETRLSAQLLPNGLWNPFAFIDACAELGRKTPESPSSTVVQHLQRIELESIIHHLLDPHPKMPVEADS